MTVSCGRMEIMALPSTFSSSLTFPAVIQHKVPDRLFRHSLHLASELLLSLNMICSAERVCLPCAPEGRHMDGMTFSVVQSP